MPGKIVNIRYQNSELQDQLAAEYVMGHLQGLARRRFEKLMLEYPGFQAQVLFWSNHLDQLNQEIETIKPPARIWTNIAQSIEPTTTQIYSKVTFWKTAGAIAATLLLAVTLVLNLPGNQPQQNLVVVVNEDAQPVWLIKNSLKSKFIEVKTLRAMKMPKNKVCVLWLVWQDGTTHSVGILSDHLGVDTMLLPAEMTRNPEKAHIAVSIENMNSNMAKPKGKVVFKGPWIEL